MSHVHAGGMLSIKLLLHVMNRFYTDILFILFIFHYFNTFYFVLDSNWLVSRPFSFVFYSSLIYLLCRPVDIVKTEDILFVWEFDHSGE